MISEARQLPMFDGEAVAPTRLVSVEAPRAKLSKAQQAFNTWVGKIARQRDKLAQWQAFVDTRYARHVALELEPLQAEMRAAQRAMVHLIDTLLAPNGERIARKQRNALLYVLQMLIDALLEEGPDAELEALHDKHSETTRDELRQAELEMTEALLGSMLGADAIKAHGATSAEDLFAHAHKKLAADAERLAAKREARQDARGGKGGASSAAAETREKAAREASQSVREIFRRLASALHPDREPDVEERARKTTLMQRANQYYERNDLLALLALQIEVEQVDADHLAGVPDQRIAHYNHVLREQLARLDAELAACTAPFKAMLGLPPWGRDVTPPMVEAALEGQLAETRLALRELQSDLQRFRDPKLRRARLKEMAHDNDGIGDAPGMGDISELLMAFDAAAGKARRGRRR